MTLDLTSADPDKEISIVVNRDTESAADAIDSFVEQYNSLIDFIDETTRFNPETSQANPLLGNRNVSDLKNALGALVTETVPGLGNLNRMSQIGIDIDGTGRLSVNRSELNRALKGEVDGVEREDIARLFGLTGASGRSGIEFLLGSSRTQSGSFAVDITQAAERASITAASTLASSVVIDSSNNQFQISIDGLQSETLTLDEGTYTQQELAAQLEARINGSADLQGSEVSVSVDGRALEITSQRYGRSSEISDLAGTALSALGFSGSESDQGQDVVGNFIVDGVVEAATGSGRVLIGDSENEFTADLQVRITLDGSQVVEGAEGDLIVSRGITARLDQYFGDLLEAETGTMATIKEDFDLRIESLDDSIARVNAISEAKTQFLIEQFTALERTLADLQNTSSFLASQLGALGG